MDLLTGNLLWPALSPETPHVPQLQNDVTCEVAIVGAGITGAMLAATLAEEGVDVVVVDKRGPAEGSTAACSALVLYEIDVPLIQLAGMVGLDHARRSYLAARRALDDLERMVDHFGVACDLRHRGSLFLAKRERDLAWFEDEVTARKLIGIEAELIEGQQLKDDFQLHRPGAIHSSAAMEIDPYCLTLGLLEAAVTRGARVFGQTDVDVDCGLAGLHVLRAQHGPRIECQHLIVATGYETPEQFHRIRDLCSLKSTYCLASEPLRGPQPWADALLLWEAADPYLYARLHNSRVILGGEDEPIVDPDRRDALIDWKVQRLLEKFATLCPGIELEPEFVWAGTFAETSDGLPYIGSPADLPGCLFALGYGGNGITFSVLASQILRDAVLGRANSEARLFGFDR